MKTQSTAPVAHTAGPWTHTPGQDTIWANDGGLLIARTDYERGAMSVNEDEHNAHLIASAPELLAALEACVACYEEHRDEQPTGHLWPDPNHIYFARNAIAKAKGVV